MEKIGSGAQKPFPRFGVLAGAGGIVVYLLSSLPFILIVAGLRIAKMQSNGEVITNEVTTKVMKDITNDPWVLIGALFVQCVSLFIFVYLVSVLRGSKNPFNDFGLKFTRWSFLYIGVGIGFQIVGLIIGIPLQLLRKTNSEQDIVTTVKSSGGIGLICLILLVAFIVPVAEEVCFRGLFLRGLNRKVTPFIAVMITGIIFAGVHLFDPGAFLGFTTLLIVGLATSAFAQYRGRLDASIFIHMGFNLTTVFFLIIAR